MLRERGGDLVVEFGDALIEGQDIPGEFTDDVRGDVLTGQRYPLGLRRGDATKGDLLPPDGPALEPLARR
jgi:hypothetical protein